MTHQALDQLQTALLYNLGLNILLPFAASAADLQQKLLCWLLSVNPASDRAISHHSNYSMQKGPF
jgi:hypothetical protein